MLSLQRMSYTYALGVYGLERREKEEEEIAATTPKTSNSLNESRSADVRGGGLDEEKGVSNGGRRWINN